MEAAALDEVSAGRLNLGVGAARWTLRALGETDERTRRPLTAMVKALRIRRELIRGEEGVDGEVFAAHAYVIGDPHEAMEVLGRQARERVL